MRRKKKLILLRATSVDIAIAVGHILDQCTSNIVPYGTVTAGQAYANNNQKIRVHAVHKQ